MAKASLKSSKKRIKFETPPINELAISLFHLPVIELKAQHIGIYWNQIRETYPICEQQSPVVASLETPPPQFLLEVPGEVFPLPRFWFSNKAHRNLIQVQRNGFMLNWRRGDTNKAEYPHYETVIKDFWKELEKYKTFIQEVVGGKLDVIQRCELTYVNIIGSKDTFSHPAEIGNVLPLMASLKALQTDIRELVGLNTTISYKINPTLMLDLAVRSGKRSDTKEPIVLLEIKAHGAPSDISLARAKGWYDSAHDAIYSLFIDATDKQVQKTVWKPQ